MIIRSDPDHGEPDGQLVKPTLVVSRCLGFAACRYDGEIIQNKRIQQLAQHVELITLCPEADMGMGIPRAPVRLIQGKQTMQLWQAASQKDWSTSMQQWIKQQRPILKRMDGCLLKARSPSCGINDCKVYATTVDDASPIAQHSGMFAAAVQQLVPSIVLENEERFNSPIIAEWFLVRLYALARARALLQAPSMVDISTFHARHKLLLMCFHQQAMRHCGRIAANNQQQPADVVANRYVAAFRHILSQEASKKNMINALCHGYGWINERLNAAQRHCFIQAIEAYRHEHATLASLQRLLQSWADHYKHDYLGRQYFIQPYPTALHKLFDANDKAF